MKPITVLTSFVFFLIGVALIWFPFIVNKFPESKSADKFQKILVFAAFIFYGLVSIGLGVARMLGKF
jgi:hypothetical protein